MNAERRHEHADSSGGTVVEALREGNQLYSSIDRVTIDDVESRCGSVLPDVDREKPAYRVGLDFDHITDEDVEVRDFVERPAYDNRTPAHEFLADYKYGFVDTLSDHFYGVIGYTTDPPALYIGRTADSRHGNFVTDPDILDVVTETQDCPCPLTVNEYTEWSEYTHPFFECLCGRKYYLAKDLSRGDVELSFRDSLPPVSNPVTALSTKRDGLIRLDDPAVVFWMVAAQSTRTAEYLEAAPYNGTCWIYASDGQIIGLLLNIDDLLEVAIISKGYRFEGHGTAMIEAWFDAVPYEEVQVDTFGHREGFAEQLPIPITDDRGPEPLSGLSRAEERMLKELAEDSIEKQDSTPEAQITFDSFADTDDA